MTTAAIASTPGVTAGPVSLSDQAKSIAANKDQFLQLLLAQMKNQDPMAPTDPSQFTSQMTQFGQLEQLFNINKSMGNFAAMQGQSSRSQAISMIGKTVTADANGLVISGQDHGSVGFNLDKSASEVDIDILNSKGQKVRSMKMSNQNVGTSTYSFDGLDNQGQPLPDGTYTLSVAAASPDGSLVTSKPVFSGHVTGVEFASDGSAVIDAGGVSFGIDKVGTVKS